MALELIDTEDYRTVATFPLKIFASILSIDQLVVKRAYGWEKSCKKPSTLKEKP